MVLQMNGRTECVRLLLGHGARHDICSSSGQTPLHGSAANRHYSVVRSLVEAGACVNAQNEYGNTPLHSAAATGSIDVLSVSTFLHLAFLSWKHVSYKTLYGSRCERHSFFGILTYPAYCLLGNLAQTSGRLRTTLPNSMTPSTFPWAM